jgi:tetratricopeptide (TPR) repeat protein
MTALLVAALLAFQAAAQPPRPSSELDATLRQARTEIAAFEKAGGKHDDPNHPVEKWVQTLWALHDKAPKTPDGAQAASEAVHLLIHADRFSEVWSRTDRLPASDPAWEGLAPVLYEAGSAQKDLQPALTKLQAVLLDARDGKVRAAIQLVLGRAWRAQQDETKAKASFESAMSSAPGSASARAAEGELYELLHLAPGQPAPAFSTTAVDGARVSLADYRGKPLVVVFWSTH